MDLKIYSIERNPQVSLDSWQSLKTFAKIISDFHLKLTILLNKSRETSMKRAWSQDELAALQQRLTRSQAELEQNQLGKNLVIVCLSVADPDP